MSYVKTTWASGDIITAQKLNNLENGVESASEAALPEYSYSEEGKFLSVSHSGNLIGASCIPSYDTSEDVDKFLSVGVSGLQWAEVEGGELPSYDSGFDTGKALFIDDQGDLAWEYPIPSYDQSDYKKSLVVDENGFLEGGSELPEGASPGYFLTAFSNGMLSGEVPEVDVLPEYSSSDMGKVLSVDGQGDLIGDEVLPPISDSGEYGGSYKFLASSGSGCPALPACNTEGYILAWSSDMAIGKDPAEVFNN